MRELEKYVENMSIEFANNSYEVPEGFSKEAIMTSLYAYYHYYFADVSKTDEVIRGIVADTEASDCISGVYIDTDSDNLDLDFVVAVGCEDGNFELAKELKKIKDAENIVNSYVDSKIIPRQKIKDIISEDEYKITSTRKIKIVLITDYNPKSAANKRSILNAFTALKPERENLSYSIVFGYDIEHEILEVENPREYVEDGMLAIDSPGNVLTYGDEKSIIVNVSAKSVKALYELYSYRGLFSQNLRYYVKNAKVDDNIILSMQEKPDNFWYYNNGIIIICDAYDFDGQELRIKKFSIINGGQTTKLIGETDFDTDFYVQCKLVKNKYVEQEERLDFIAAVAEASNTQKPIKDKDLIANKTEQRLLKKQLADAGIYCQIKRGEKVNKKLYPMPWQNTTNEELGQFLLSYVYQKPGTARSNKASICGNKERYTLLYGKKYDSAFLRDLLKIKAYYKLWLNQEKKNDDASDPYRMGLINNGMLYMTSIIGAVCKIYYHEDYAKSIANSVMTEQKMEIISQHDIDHGFLNPEMDEKKKIFELFEFCYVRFYRQGYEFLKTFKEKYNNYSNFTKVNSNYASYVFKQIAFEFRNGISGTDKEFLDSVFYQASTEEIDRDRMLLDKYVNVVFVDLNAESSIPDEKVAEIKEALIEYRTKAYKLNRVKAYEVFKNVAADRIAKFAPETVEELTELRCLDEAQISLYGEDIIEIIKSVMSE
ncbi:MAG: AIPR family protein [Eubacteriales bacterium]|nr:AIPR family protein [Eubacteriales bacterium]